MAMLLKQSGWRKIIITLLMTGLILSFSGFSAPETVSAAENPVTIKVDGKVIHTFTWGDLQDMRSDEEVWVEARPYSTINTWPTKKWYASEGVKLTALFEAAGIDLDGLGIQAIKVESVDSFRATFTKKQLFDDTRYYFPGLKDNHGDFGQVPGTVRGKVPVDAIIALSSVEGSDNPDYMNPLNCPLLVVGQHYVTEQTNHTFVKNVGEIDLLTEVPKKWAKPTATPGPGTVPVGTKVELKNEFNDDDKIYYTTDDTEPTQESLIYNWVAKRWWASREADLDEINKPIEITEDTVIKAKTIGLGREDSDIVTFEYKVETVAVTGVNILEDDLTLEEGETIQLNAVVEPDKAANKNIAWSTDDVAVVAVDEETGLVTAVSEGETVVTVTTEDGNFTDSITVTVVPAEVIPVTYTVSFSIKDGETVVEDATIEVKNSEGEVMVAEADGNYKLAAGGYTCTVTKEGFKRATRTFTVESGVTVINVTLEREADDMPKYNVIPEEDPVYTIGETEEGIKTMTVKSDQTGLNYFTVAVEPIKPHEGIETVVFTHIRNGVQLQLNALEADFDKVNAAKAGFNVRPGDVIKAYIVDKLTNDRESNPIIYNN